MASEIGRGSRACDCDYAVGRGNELCDAYFTCVHHGTSVNEMACLADSSNMLMGKFPEDRPKMSRRPPRTHSNWRRNSRRCPKNRYNCQTSAFPAGSTPAPRDQYSSTGCCSHTRSGSSSAGLRSLRLRGPPDRARASGLGSRSVRDSACRSSSRLYLKCPDCLR